MGDDPLMDIAGHIIELANKIHDRYSFSVSFDQSLRLAQDLVLSDSGPVSDEAVGPFTTFQDT